MGGGTRQKKKRCERRRKTRKTREGDLPPLPDLGETPRTSPTLPYIHQEDLSLCLQLGDLQPLTGPSFITNQPTPLPDPGETPRKSPTLPYIHQEDRVTSEPATELQSVSEVTASSPQSASHMSLIHHQSTYTSPRPWRDSS